MFNGGLPLFGYDSNGNWIGTNPVLLIILVIAAVFLFRSK
jgi:hypothetical protein